MTYIHTYIHTYIIIMMMLVLYTTGPVKFVEGGHPPAGHLAAQRSEEPTEPVRQKIAPLAFVMRWNLDLKHVEILAGVQKAGGAGTVGSQWGYAVSPGNASYFNFSVELHSLRSDTSSHTTEASLALSISGREEVGAQTREVKVSGMGAVNASWVVDLTKHADATGEVILSVAATKPSSATNIALPLVIRLIVGQWDCFSRGALNSATQCPNGKCALCGDLPKDLV
jgi:hypothetical protein